MQIFLKTEATPEVIENAKPDVVIVATGSVPLIPKIRGSEGQAVVTARDILAGRVEAGQRVVVVGGGQVGCECADYLAEKGRTVTIVEMLEELAPDMYDTGMKSWLILTSFPQNRVTVLTRTKVEEITGEGVVCIDENK